ncbi:CLASP N terminal-domain containing protein [Nitzschia inconspicua]|uniref:CLASP N terminal-domain containing protein n=1 Tax=Nitzschia inconspicua TaxID=303405 RepID=A0A9K3KZC0_9STRA|nr:CLASP N terminal-domain containing protein [Nitzschia inconspicua]
MFRSPDSRVSPRVPKHHITEGPIHDFTAIIEKTPPEDWQRRTSALQTLVGAIPSEDDQYYHNINNNNNNSHDDENNNDANEQWYNSPPILRHLAIPLSELLKDPRSTVVKRTCENCEQLFDKCQVQARYLLKDIMPAIIQVHASTVAVIRQYVQTMVVHAIAIVPCKMTMPLWLDRLKHDKSRTVREACCLYLSRSIEEWSNLMEDGYLTKDIFHQVGTAFIKALRDASPQVRQQARKGLEVFYGLQPDVLDHLVSIHPELTRDLRTKKLLQRIQAGETVGADDVSVTSRVSRMSIASAPVRGVRSGMIVGTPSRLTTTTTTTTNKRRNNNNYNIGSAVGGISTNSTGQYRAKPPSMPPTSSSLSSSTYDIPTTIGVATTVMTTAAAAAHSSSSKTSNGLGPPQRIVANSYSIDSVEEESRRNGNDSNATETTLSNNLGTTIPASVVHLGVNDEIPLLAPPSDSLPPMSSKLLNPDDDANRSFESVDTDMSELQTISNTTELRQVAKSRGMNGRRSSLLLQDRLMRRSAASASIPEGNNENEHSSVGDEHSVPHISTNNNNNNNSTVPVRIDSSVTNMVEIAHLGADEIANHPQLPEHTKIAHQLLEAHKVHIDQVMEVLKVEMDALKDFELILLEDGPRRPTEEEVLEYFESLGLCLEQRTKAGQILQRKMDRISQGS